MKRTFLWRIETDDLGSKFLRLKVYVDGKYVAGSLSSLPRRDIPMADEIMFRGARVIKNLGFQDSFPHWYK